MAAEPGKAGPKGLERQEHRQLYELIVRQREAGAQLSQVEEHMARFGITRQTTARLLKELIQRKLIAQGTQHNSEVYYGADFAPQSRNLPSWYVQQHFDEGYANELLGCVRATVQQARNQVVNMDYIVSVVQNRPQVKQYISREDIKTLVQALVYDGELVQYEDQVAGCTCYQAPSQPQMIFGPYYQGNYLRTVPCGRCQLLQLCENGGAISCRECPYIKQWLRGRE